MENQRTIGTVLLIVGVLILIVSLVADVIGLGATARFGYWQITGVVVGALVAIAGLVFALRK